MQRLILATLSAATLGLTLSTGAEALNPIELSTLLPTDGAAETVAIAPAIGQFVTVDQGKTTTGTASIVMENGATYLVFDEAFSTATGPDLLVVLYADGAEVPVNIEGANYVVLDDLQSLVGGQRYRLDASIAIDEYDAVAIWCREFDSTFGYAPL